ncbi:MAG: GNAT family N-acetyltransferase [Flavobacteriaceae bacterium]|nr:GNAT family N-acetyltransferase [Flavobacteriaceae bacterium]
MEIDFRKLSEINKNELIELMNNLLVRKQMPLLRESFGEDEYKRFIEDKNKHWNKFGFGIWAFFINNRFIGWGGLQVENDETDLALVLHPDFWGSGKYIYEKIVNIAFNELDVPSITVLLPPTRTRIKGILRLGFVQNGNYVIGDVVFIRYKLDKSNYNKIK